MRRRIAVLVVGAMIASMTLLASPARADVCTGGKYNVCVCTENCYCFETVNNAWRAFFGSDLIVCH